MAKKKTTVTKTTSNLTLAPGADLPPDWKPPGGEVGGGMTTKTGTFTRTIGVPVAPAPAPVTGKTAKKGVATNPAGKTPKGKAVGQQRKAQTGTASGKPKPTGTAKAKAKAAKKITKQVRSYSKKKK